MAFTVIIPARLGSQRLPGKPLLDIAGKTMIQRVWERCKASGADQVIVATDDSTVAATVTGFGGLACLTSDRHESGTDRIQEVARKLGLGADAIVVNVQGDEPLIPPAVIDQVAAALEDGEWRMATLCARIETTDELLDPNIVKVVLDRRGQALYFSRAPIPWQRGVFPLPAGSKLTAAEPFYRHLGIYAYKVSLLDEFVQHPPCPLELIEKLEQLRVLWHGDRILVREALALVPAGVDTPEDLARVRRMVAP